MQSNHLVIQVDIGQGTQWGNNQTINPIREIFIPSVREYCSRFNYDYLSCNVSFIFKFCKYFIVYFARNVSQHQIANNSLLCKI